LSWFASWNLGWTPLDLLPGLYVLFLTMALAGALRRWFDPVPWRVVAVFFLLVSLLYGPALFAGWTLLPVGNVHGALPFHHQPPMPLGNWIQGDLVHQITPWIVEVKRAVLAGRWPLWNAGAGTGMPLMGDPQSQFPQPLVLLAWPFAMERAAGVTGALRVLVALTFTFLFLRRQGIGPAAAGAGGIAYGLGGFVMLWLGWPIGNVAAWLPAVLYGVARCDEPGGRRDRILLFAAVAALLLGGHPETMLYGLLVSGSFLLARALIRISGRDRARLLVQGGLAFLLAVLLTAPVLLLAHEYLPQTLRASVIHFRHASGPPPAEILRDMARPDVRRAWADRASERLLLIAAPRALGDLREYWGQTNLIEDAGGTAGTAALLAALAALLPSLRRGTARARFPHERFFAVTLGVCLALLAQPPGFDRLLLGVPLLGVTAVHQHHRIYVLVTFCIAVLAAAEVERWQRGEGRRGAVLLAAALLGGLIVWAFFAHPSPKTGKIVTGLLEGGLAAQLAALGLTAALLLTRPGNRWKQAAAWGLVAVAAAELLALHHPVNPPMPSRVLYADTEPVRFLRRHAGPYRIFALGGNFPSNIPLVFGLRDVRIDNPSLPAAYANLVAPLSRDPLVPRFGRPAHPVYDLLGARYVVARPRLRLPFKLVLQHRDGWVWERPRFLPPLFLPRRARVIRDEIWPEWVHRNHDFAARALVQPAPERRRHWQSRPRIPARLDLVTLQSARVRARVDLGEPRLLASSLYQDGNWHLLVDRERTPTVLANGPLVAAWLPAGEHGVELLYRPRRLLAGCALAALALAAACALWVPPPGLRSAGRRVVS
jgi:hypothetical protein